MWRKKNVTLSMIAGLLFVFLYGTMFYRNQNQIANTYVAHHGLSTQRIEALRKCKFIYIDLGSNIGVQTRKLFQPELYPKAKVLPHFDREFGDVQARRKHVCVFGFEANPRHTNTLQRLERCYNNKDWYVIFYNKVVSNRSNETLVILSDKSNLHQDWGAGLSDTLFKRRNMDIIKHNVSTIDIAAFIKGIEQRYQPEKVLMKMDIEGSEFVVLPHMLKENVLCKDKVDFISLEFHEWARKSFGNSELSLSLFNKSLHEQDCDPTKIINLDDETYHNDVNFDPCD